MLLIPVVRFNYLVDRPAGLLHLMSYLLRIVYGDCRIASIGNYQFNG